MRSWFAEFVRLFEIWPHPPDGTGHYVFHIGDIWDKDASPSHIHPNIGMENSSIRENLSAGCAPFVTHPEGGMIRPHKDTLARPLAMSPSGPGT